jgi:uncharacterized protein (TIGR03382 family)
VILAAMRTLAILLVAACAVDVSETEQEVTGRKCPDGATIQGIDVSEYQGSVDWSAVKASGRVFGIARINVSGHLDPYFAANWRDMKAAGVIRGAYQYYKPSYDPVAEANLVVQTLGRLAPDDLPAMLDIEITSGVDRATVVTRLAKWLEIVEAGTGKRPLMYTGAYFWDDNIASTAFASYPLVIPWYGTTCPGVPNAWNAPGWKFHQYSESGTVPGVSSNPTDLDVFNGSEAQLRAFIGAARPCGTIAAEGGTIDDDNACFTAGGPSQFLRHVSSAGEGGGLIWTHATEEPSESNYATWNLQVAAAGRYVVEVSTPAAFAQSKQAHYAIRAAGATTVVDLDQTAVDGWQSLGTFDFAEGGDQSVHLGDNTGEPESANVQLVFDAVRLTPAPPGGGGGDPGGDDAPGDEPGGGRGAGCTTTGGGGSLVLVLAALVALLRARYWARRLDRV